MLAEGSRQKIPGWRGVEREFFHVPQMLENPGVINRGSPGSFEKKMMFMHASNLFIRASITPEPRLSAGKPQEEAPPSS